MQQVSGFRTRQVRHKTGTNPSNFNVSGITKTIINKQFSREMRTFFFKKGSKLLIRLCNNIFYYIKEHATQENATKHSSLTQNNGGSIIKA